MRLSTRSRTTRLIRMTKARMEVTIKRKKRRRSSKNNQQLKRRPTNKMEMSWTPPILISKSHNKSHSSRKLTLKLKKLRSSRNRSRSPQSPFQNKWKRNVRNSANRSCNYWLKKWTTESPFKISIISSMSEQSPSAHRHSH